MGEEFVLIGRRRCREKVGFHDNGLAINLENEVVAENDRVGVFIVGVRRG